MQAQRILLQRFLQTEPNLCEYHRLARISYCDSKDLSAKRLFFMGKPRDRVRLRQRP